MKNKFKIKDIVSENGTYTGLGKTIGVIIEITEEIITGDIRYTVLMNNQGRTDIPERFLRLATKEEIKETYNI